MKYSLDFVFDQGELRWMAILAQKGLCICGKKVTLKNGQLHHALLSRQDVLGYPEADRIHHPYNVLMLHDQCHENITRRQSCEVLSKIYSYSQILEWYNSFTFQSNFRKLDEDIFRKI